MIMWLFCIAKRFNASFLNKAKGAGLYDSATDWVYYVSMMGNASTLHLMKINAVDGSFAGSQLIGSETCQQLYSLVSYSSDISDNR